MGIEDEAGVVSLARTGLMKLIEKGDIILVRAIGENEFTRAEVVNPIEPLGAYVRLLQEEYEGKYDCRRIVKGEVMLVRADELYLEENAKIDAKRLKRFSSF